MLARIDGHQATSCKGSTMIVMTVMIMLMMMVSKDKRAPSCWGKVTGGPMGGFPMGGGVEGS